MSTLEQAEHLMREGAFQSAKTILSEIISEDPNDLRAICDIGIAYTETGENLKAIKALKYYIKKDKTNPYAWKALGCAQFRTGELAQARSSLSKSIEIMPENLPHSGTWGFFAIWKANTKRDCCYFNNPCASVRMTTALCMP